MKSQEQCKGCVYWRSGAGGAMWDAMYMCHHLLDTGKRRIDQDGKCLSKTTSRQQKQKKISKAQKENKCKKKVKSRTTVRRQTQKTATKEPKENKVKKKVKAVEDNIVFESMTAAEKHYGLAHGRVCEVTNNPRKTARGQHFVTV